MVATVAGSFNRAWTSVRQWPGMRSEYSWIPAGSGPTLTKSGQVGVSFSQHRGAVYEWADRTIQGDIVAGSVIVTGDDPIAWMRVRETTDAMEIYPDLHLMRSLAPGITGVGPALARRDGTVLGIASILKRVHTTNSTLSDIAASTLAHQLAGHLIEYYCGRSNLTRPTTGRLHRSTVDRVARFIDAELGGTVTLDRLAGVAMLSPFYFARAFKATTGLSPHEFVTERRMHRATILLVESAASVEEVAHAVGLANVSHFRRLFRQYLGVRPVDLRQDSKIGPSFTHAGLRRLWRADKPALDSPR